MLDITENMAVVIIYYEKNVVRKAEVLTKEKYYDMWAYLKDNYQNKNLLNKIYNFLNNKVDSEILTKLKNNSNVNDFLNALMKLQYSVQRKLYFYLYEK